MKRAKKLYVMLGVLAVMCIAAFVATNYEEKQEQIKNSDEIILEIVSGEVTSISWKNETTSLSFTKGEVWTYDEDEAFPVDEEKITDLIEVFESFGVSFVIEEAEDLNQYGLQSPTYEITIATETETYEISLGDFSSMDSKRYVSIGDGNVYLVNDDPAEAYDVELADMILHDDIENFETVESIAFQGAATHEIIYGDTSTVSYCEDDVYFIEEDGKKLPLDTINVDAYLEKISGLGLSTYVTYNVTEEDLVTYGLAEPELAIMVKWTTESEEESGTEEKELLLQIGCDEDETAYVRVDESKIIYEITVDEYNYLMSMSYSDLRHQEIFTADFADINEVQITLDGEEYSVTSKEEDDEIIYYYGETELTIDAFQSALELLEADEFTEDKATGKEEVRMTLQLNNKNLSEMEIVLYKYDGSNCLAEVNGESVALVSRSLVVDLVEAVNEIVLD